MHKIITSISFTFFISIAFSNPAETVDNYEWLPLEEDEETISYFYFNSEDSNTLKELWIRTDYKEGFGGLISKSISHELLDCEKSEMLTESYTMYGKDGSSEIIPAGNEITTLEQDSETSDALLYNKICTK
jgi:hypothetical protein